MGPLLPTVARKSLAPLSKRYALPLFPKAEPSSTTSQHLADAVPMGAVAGNEEMPQDGTVSSKFQDLSVRRARNQLSPASLHWACPRRREWLFKRRRRV